MIDGSIGHKVGETANTDVFTPEHIELAAGKLLSQGDFDKFALLSRTNTGKHSALSRSRNSWSGLAKCYWYSTHVHPLHIPPPMLPNLPLKFENTEGGLSDVNRWQLDLSTLMELLNSYYSFKADNPQLKQTDILSRHLWNVSLDFLNDFAVHQLEVIQESAQVVSGE